MVIVWAVVYTLICWVIHAALVGFYSRFFDDLGSLGFRILHFIEISLVVAVGFIIFFRQHPEAAWLTTALSVLATLIVIDLVFFGALRNSALLQQFDKYHFLAAYAAIIIATYAAY